MLYFRRLTSTAPWLHRALLALSLGLAAAAQAAAPSEPATAPSASPAPFQASYSWYWHGMRVAVSTISLQHRDDDTWVESSTASPRGVGRLYPMRPKLTSVMRILPNGVVEPLSFSATGSGANHDAMVTFDWTSGRASGVYEGAKVDLPIKPGVQDDLSVQVAMLTQLLQGRAPDLTMELNRNAVREYDYTREGMTDLSTSLGLVATIIYVAHAPGSPRYTRFWSAPSFGYVPMQVQQTRLDSVEWTMKIRTLKRG